MEFFFPSHWHTQRWTIPPVDKSCVCCQQTLSLRGCDLQPHTHPTGSLRVPQCSVRWKAHVPTSPLNDRAADHFKQNFPSVGGGMLKSLSRYPGELFGTLSTCVCVCVQVQCLLLCLFTVGACVRAHWFVLPSTSTQMSVCMCTSVHMSALEFFCPAVWNTADVFSSPPRKPPPLSPSLLSPLTLI